jgi:uncharacterized protein (DUF2236 family)
MISALQDLMLPPKGMEFDFSNPAGEPALAPHDGVSWRIFANPVSLFVGGVAAVLLELAEPSVRSGVWDHSSFRRDPGLRLRRTGFAAMMTVYGPRSAAAAMIANIVRMHSKVEGRTSEGRAYYANDPVLLDWVQATAVFGFTEAYHRFVKPLLPGEKGAAFAEGAPAAQLYGATGAPLSWEEWEHLLVETAPRLESSPVLAEFLQIMRETKILPRPLRWLQRLLVRAAVTITPEPVRSMPQLQGQGLRPGELVLARSLGAGARLLPLGNTPQGRAARRLGA